MKFRRLPPLHTLEAFEHAARGGSFKVAAEHLHLTPSAVSHQVKALEAFLGFELFRRGNRSLELTGGGRDYLEVVQDTLGRLRDGSHRVAQRHTRAKLSVSMGPFLATEVIVPALPTFQAQNPHVDVHIETTLRPVDLLHEDMDVALRFGDGRWPKLAIHRLLTVDAVPVCTPAVARTLRAREPSDLGGVTLIHSTPVPDGWSDWARSVGVKLGKPRSDLWLDSYLAILRAAEQGLGLAIGMTPIVNPWLKRKRLAMPWPKLRSRIPQGYYLLHRLGDEERPEVAAFHRWIDQLLHSDVLHAP